MFEVYEVDTDFNWSRNYVSEAEDCMTSQFDAIYQEVFEVKLFANGKDILTQKQFVKKVLSLKSKGKCWLFSASALRYVFGQYLTLGLGDDEGDEVVLDGSYE